MNLNQLHEQMSKSLEILRDKLVGIHSGNVGVGIIGTVKVSCYDHQQIPLAHLSSITISGNRISIVPYDPTIIKAVELSLRKSNFNASIFSKKEVVVTIPQMSGEQKSKTIAIIKGLGEETKIAIRNIRKHFRSSLDDDDRKKSDNQIQKVTDEFISTIENLVESKIQQL